MRATSSFRVFVISLLVVDCRTQGRLHKLLLLHTFLGHGGVVRIRNHHHIYVLRSSLHSTDFHNHLLTAIYISEVLFSIESQFKAKNRITKT